MSIGPARPTIFLSSTVHDFSDLRSALKDYLEARGCRVLASEFTDFTRPLDKHSYDACLETIEQADLFVLFIGRRVGGWFDEPNKVSITREEYRCAYKLAKQSKIKILCFVRSDVFNHRQSVRELTKALKADRALSDNQRRRLANHPTIAMDNAEAIISFIDEVTRNGETVAASKGLATAPVANWISPFTTFTEVRQALDPLIAGGLTVSEAAGRKALEVQLIKLLQGVAPLVDGKVINPVNSVLRIRRELGIKAEQLTATIKVPEKLWNRLVFTTVLSRDGGIDPTPLQAALTSDLLLKYDPVSGSYHETEEYRLLSHVVDQARHFVRSASIDGAELFKHGRAAETDGTRHVPGHILISWMHRILRWVDLIGSARALVSCLNGEKLESPPAVPQSPLIDQEQQLQAESATEEQVRAFVSSQERSNKQASQAQHA